MQRRIQLLPVLQEMPLEVGRIARLVMTLSTFIRLVASVGANVFLHVALAHQMATHGAQDSLLDQGRRMTHFVVGVLRGRRGVKLEHAHQWIPVLLVV